MTGLFAAPGDSRAQSAENVAVVINEASADSRRIGEYYAQKRGVPASQIIRLTTKAEEEIDFATYGRTIETPIARTVAREKLHDRILYLVLTKGVPLRIRGTIGRTGTVASVDSELTLLYRRLTGRPVRLNGPASNPYFLGTKPIRDAQPFTHRAYDFFLVTRLDGFSAAEVIALIDRAQTPSIDGKIVLDQRSGLASVGGDEWLELAAARLRDLGHSSRVVLESTGKPAGNMEGVLGYYSWGSNEAQNRRRRTGLRFVPGALASMFLSTDGRTFRAPPDEWQPAETTSAKSTWFAGSPQSLAGDLIAEGVTGIAANVAEPFLDGAVRPEILFPAYLAGFSLAESFYLALPNLSWQTIVIGDPLCAPFRKTSLVRAEIEEPLDPATELPGAFSKRRLEIARAQYKDAPAAAVSLVVQSDTRLAAEDIGGARKALEDAAALAPAAAGVQLKLALFYESLGEVARAIDRYRQVVKLQPNNAGALNNLAYNLAVKNKAPEEALPLATRAVTLQPNNPATIDTLAWTQHLLGNDAEAAKLLRPLTTKNTGRAEIHLHAAVVFAAVGESNIAKAQLSEALRLDPSLAGNDDVKTLRARLGVKHP